MSNLPALEMSAESEAPSKSAAASDPRLQIFSLTCRHVRKLVGVGAHDYDDIVQAAAERALRDLPKYEGRCSLSTWVFRVCYSALIDHRRIHRRWLTRFRLSPSHELNDALSVNPAAEKALETVERNARLQAVLQRMSPKRASVVMLHDLQGMPVAAIAEVLGINDLTVRSRLRDGRKELARRLKRDPYFGDQACNTREQIP
jgi:RNA polymerase sigma-70 factor (ECF subfamily)